MNEEFWRAASERWQDLVPEVRTAIRAAATLLVTVFVARAAGWMTDRRLRAAHFEALFRRPWLPTPAAIADPHRPTPTKMVTALVRLTAWAGGVWVFAYLSDWPEVARGLESVVGRVWGLVAVILAALCLSRLFTGKLVEVAQASPIKEKLDAWQSAAAARESRVSGPVVAAGLLADVVVTVLALLVAADLFRLPLTGQALEAVWQVILHLFTAAVALLIGWLGARWVRAQAAAEPGPVSSPAGYGAYAAASVMAGAALLAILLLAGNFPTYFGLVLLVLVVMLVWPAQRWLPDIYAGFLLRTQGVKEVRIDGVPCPLAPVGLVQTDLAHPDGVQTWRNRAVLEAHLGSPQTGTGTDEAGSPDGKQG
ncbi:MAG TPA: hypothetical protein VM597_38145 [Gemmataceae bacterium]|nr:hypothetical protein [Gemmataceae bacterium]